jgi:hypothetical protein
VHACSKIKEGEEKATKPTAAADVRRANRRKGKCRQEEKKWGPAYHTLDESGREKKTKTKMGKCSRGEPGRRFPWVFFLFNFEIHFLFLITDYIYIPKIQNKNFNIISISKIHIFFQKNNCSSP